MVCYGELCQTAGNQMGGLSLGRAVLQKMCSITCRVSSITGLVWVKLLGGNCFQAAGKRLPSGKGNRQNEPPECPKRSQARQEERRASFSPIWIWLPIALISAGWLDDIGLPQYKDQFHESRVDGRMLQYLTVVSTVLSPQFYQF